jgi:serine/threonine-protein kinase
VGAAGLIGIGIGTVYGLQAANQWSQAKPYCNGGACSTNPAFASWQDSRSSASTATVAFVVGGVAVAGGLALWLTAPSSPVRVGATPGAVVARGEF